MGFNFFATAAAGADPGVRFLRFGLSPRRLLAAAQVKNSQRLSAEPGAGSSYWADVFFSPAPRPRQAGT